ncbi:hypothetical protein SLS60_011248 [Paraconiothyrium brasiliense]|uniref:RING-type domain-containing protein n=1 Tax=Paraconiothyrium brasiliense TaxID=300254 RepID=A0ABR3QKZ9_9PLEO
MGNQISTTYNDFFRNLDEEAVLNSTSAEVRDQAQTLQLQSGLRLDHNITPDAQDANGSTVDQEDMALDWNDIVVEDLSDPDIGDSTLQNPVATSDVMSAIQFFARVQVPVTADDEEQNEDLPSRDEFMDPNNPNPGLLILTDPRATARPSEDDICSVCREDMEALDGLEVIVSCGHIFHRPCLDTWLQTPTSGHGTCPLCRCVLFTIPSAEDDDDDGEALSYPDSWLRARFEELLARIRDLHTRVHELNDTRQRLEDTTTAFVLSGHENLLYEERDRLRADYLAVARLSAARGPGYEDTEAARLVQLGEHNERNRQFANDLIRSRARQDGRNKDTDLFEHDHALLRRFDESDRRFGDLLTRFIDEALSRAEAEQAAFRTLLAESYADDMLSRRRVLTDDEFGLMMREYDLWPADL